MDATFFDCETALRHCRNRLGRHIRTLRTTALVDVDSCAVLSIHYSAHWLYDTQTGSQVFLHNPMKIGSLAEIKTFNDQAFGTAPTQRCPTLAASPAVSTYGHAHGWTASYTDNAGRLRPTFVLSSVDLATYPHSLLIDFGKLFMTNAVCSINKQSDNDPLPFMRFSEVECFIC
jgi:IS5 family transposase